MYKPRLKKHKRKIDKIRLDKWSFGKNNRIYYEQRHPTFRLNEESQEAKS
jgi:hypothetical protein